MNWYKKAQILMPTTDPYLQNYQGVRNYISIGHEENDNTKNEIWYWDGENLISSPDIVDKKGKKERETHQSLWGYLGSVYKGRYEEKDGHKRLSLAGPPSARFKKIPSILLRAIKEKWGEAVEIYPMF